MSNLDPEAPAFPELSMIDLAKAAIRAKAAEDNDPTSVHAAEGLIEFIDMAVHALGTVEKIGDSLERIAKAAETMAENSDRIGACASNGYFDVRAEQG